MSLNQWNQIEVAEKQKLNEGINLFKYTKMRIRFITGKTGNIHVYVPTCIYDIFIQQVILEMLLYKLHLLLKHQENPNPS